MKQIVNIIKKLNVLNPKFIWVEQTEENVFFYATNEENVFGWAFLKTNDQYGNFVINNIPTLLGLFSFDGYKTENAKIEIKFNLENNPVSIEFDDKLGTKTSYKLAHPKSFTLGKRVGNATPDMVFKPDFEKIKNFSKLYGIFKEKLFWTHSEGDKLIAGFGIDNSLHNSQMILHDSDAMKLTQKIYWNADNFLRVLQLDQSDTSIRINQRGQLVIDFKSDDVDYQFAFVGQKV